MVKSIIYLSYIAGYGWYKGETYVDSSRCTDASYNWGSTSSSCYSEIMFILLPFNKEKK